jgi:hypothetical protein
VLLLCLRPAGGRMPAMDLARHERAGALQCARWAVDVEEAAQVLRRSKKRNALFVAAPVLPMYFACRMFRVTSQRLFRMPFACAWCGHVFLNLRHRTGGLVLCVAPNW